MTAAVSIDRIASYSKNFHEFKIKALARWRKAQSELSDTHGIDFKHMSMKSRIVVSMIKHGLYFSLYALSKIKAKIKG